MTEWKLFNICKTGLTFENQYGIPANKLMKKNHIIVIDTKIIRKADIHL